MNTNLTTKQRQILTVICAGNCGTADFEPVDMIGLLDRIPYETTKDSMHFSIRALVRRGLITKDYDRRGKATRAVFTPTDAALRLMGLKTEPVSFIETPSDTSLAHALIH